MVHINIINSSTSSGITKPDINDVLFGRGGKINDHPGNIQFRSIVEQCKYNYTQLRSKREKRRIALEVIDQIRSLGGKFLECDTSSGCWFEQSKVKVFKKASQALREGAPRLRQPSVGSESELVVKDQKPLSKQIDRLKSILKRTNTDPIELYNSISWESDADGFYDLHDSFAGRDSYDDHKTFSLPTMKRHQSFQRMHSLALSDIDETDQSSSSFLFKSAENPFVDECEDEQFCAGRDIFPISNYNQITPTNFIAL